MNELLNYRDRAISEMIENERKNDAKKYYNKYKSQLKLRNCPVCGSEKFTHTEKYLDSFEVAKCIKCMSLYINPAPNEELLNDYYNNSKSVCLLSEAYAKRDNQPINVVTDFRATNVLNNIIQTNKNELNILEVGCNEGAFLQKLKRMALEKNIVLNLYGIEPNYKSYSIAKKSEINVGNFLCGKVSINSFFKVKFDMILSFELIEHLLDPYTFLIELKNNLVDEGEIHLSMPNSLGLENILTGYNGYRQLAHAVSPPAHLNAFNTQNILHLCLRAGLSMSSIRATGRFDVAALEEYSKQTEIDTFDNDEISNLMKCDTKTLQKLVNVCHGSSAMYVVMTNT